MARLTNMNLRIFEPSAMFGQLAICLLVLWSILGTAQDQTTAPTDQGRPLPPPKPFITMSEKVADANHIFVGIGTRIYFVDKHAREVPFGSSESERGGGIKNAILEIKIGSSDFRVGNWLQICTNMAQAPFASAAAQAEQAWKWLWEWVSSQCFTATNWLTKSDPEITHSKV